MKKLLVALLLFLLPSLCFGQEQLARLSPAIVGGGVAAAGASAFCPTGDTLCEDVEGSTNCITGSNPYCANTWTILSTAGGTITWNNTPAGSMGCTNTNSRNIQLAFSGSGDSVMIQAPTFSSTSYVSFIGYIRHSSGGGANVADIANEYDWNLLTLTLIESGGTVYLKGSWRDSLDAWHDSSSIVITSGNWYPFRMTFNASTLQKIEVDLNDDGDFADTNEVFVNNSTNVPTNSDMQKVWVGSNDVYSAVTYQVDQIAVKTGSGNATLCTR